LSGSVRSWSATLKNWSLTRDDPARVRVTHYEFVTWGDSSLGCPRAFAPAEHVKTPGFSVTIIAGGHVLDYRTDDVGNRVLLCGVQSLPDR
jgi:hypothetical protein